VSPESKLPLWLALPYAAWAVTSFLMLGLLTLLALLLLPGLVLRRRPHSPMRRPRPTRPFEGSSPVAKNPADDEINDKEMPLLDHLIELRNRLMYSVAALFVAFLVCYYFADEIYNFLVQPLADASGGEGRRMIYTGLTEVFFTYVKVAFFAGLCVSFPIIAGQLYAFVAPGLYRKEKRAFLPFLVALNEFDDAPRYPIEDIRQALAVSADVPILSIDARRREPAKQALVSLTEYALRKVMQGY